MRKFISFVTSLSMAATFLALPAGASYTLIFDIPGVTYVGQPISETSTTDSPVIVSASTQESQTSFATSNSIQMNETAMIASSSNPVNDTTKIVNMSNDAGETGVVGTPPAPELPFTDVSQDNWAYPFVKYAYENELFRGTSATTFNPTGNMTRAMFVTVLYRQAALLGQDTSASDTSQFTDIANSNAEFQRAIRWAAEHGIVTGKTETTFAPNDIVTRQQMCAMMVRYLRDYLKYDLVAYVGQSQFADSSSISSYAAEAVSIMQKMEIISGKEVNGQTIFDPNGSASRAAVAKVISLMAQAIPTLTKQTTTPSGNNNSNNNNSNSGSTSSSGSSSGGGSGGGGSSSGGSGGSGGGGSSGGGSGGSGGGGSSSGGSSTTHTDAEITQERNAITYMQTMISNYTAPTSASAKECTDIIINILNGAVSAHSSGSFVDKSYIDSQYATQINNFKTKYEALDSNAKSEVSQAILALDTSEHLQTVMNYFDISVNSIRDNVIEHTEEEIAHEKEVIGYIQTMIQNYADYGEPKSANVKECMDILMDALKKAVAAHENGDFIDQDYVLNHYGSDVNLFREKYNAFEHDDKVEINNIILRLETTYHLQEVMSYFGASVSYFS